MYTYAAGRWPWDGVQRERLRAAQAMREEQAQMQDERMFEGSLISCVTRSQKYKMTTDYTLRSEREGGIKFNRRAPGISISA